MSVHFHKELEQLRKKILAEAALVERTLERTILALERRDEKLAGEIIAGDREIDALEIEVEEDCLKMMALYNPVAVDLRFIVSVLKVNNDLERMGDLCVSMARRAAWLSRHENILLPADFSAMTRAVTTMVGMSLDALINSNADLALQVIRADDEVDSLKRRINSELRDRLMREPAAIRASLKLMDVSRHLERVADIATAIGEDVIYLVNGEIVRHKMLNEEEG